MAFLRAAEPFIWLRRYGDGSATRSILPKRGARLHKLFEMVESPRDIFAAVPGDEDVFVDVASKKGARYPRFYLSRK